MPTVRRQHFVNEAYLQHFCDPALDPRAVWLYRREHDFGRDFAGYTPEIRTPKNLCVQRDFYEGSDLPTNTIEAHLSKIEGDFESLVQTKILKKLPLLQQDNKVIARYITMMQNRTLAQKKHMESVQDDLIAKVEAMEKRHGIPPTKSEELKASKANNEIFIMGMTVAEEMRLHAMTSWLILESTFKDCYFLTCDHPTLRYDFSLMNSFYGIPAFCKTTEITLPITPRFAIVGNYLDVSGYRDAHPNKVEEVNQRTIMAADKEFYSNHKLTERELHAILRHHRQCLVLDLVVEERITTRADRLVRKHQKAEKIAAWMMSRWWLRWLFVLIRKWELRGVPSPATTDESEERQ